MKEETKEKLVTVDRFNNGKRAEERDRVKHSTEGLMKK